jgi:hypothetical protein
LLAVGVAMTPSATAAGLTDAHVSCVYMAPAAAPGWEPPGTWRKVSVRQLHA